jgi:hypothetical protein
VSLHHRTFWFNIAGEVSGFIWRRESRPVKRIAHGLLLDIRVATLPFCRLDSSHGQASEPIAALKKRSRT